MRTAVCCPDLAVPEPRRYFSSATVPTERCKEHGLFSRPTKEPEDNREEEDEWDDQEEEPVEPEESEEEEQEEEQEDPWWWGWWN